MNCSCCGAPFFIASVGSVRLCDGCYSEYQDTFRPVRDSAATDYIDGPNLSPGPHSPTPSIPQWKLGYEGDES